MIYGDRVELWSLLRWRIKIFYLHKSLTDSGKIRNFAPFQKSKPRFQTIKTHQTEKIEPTTRSSEPFNPSPHPISISSPRFVRVRTNRQWHSDTIGAPPTTPFKNSRNHNRCTPTLVIQCRGYPGTALPILLHEAHCIWMCREYLDALLSCERVCFLGARFCSAGKLFNLWRNLIILAGAGSWS